MVRRDVYDRITNSAHVIDKRAGENADEVCRFFVSKNVRKLDSIVEAKGNFTGIDIVSKSLNPSGMEGRLRLRFDDGTSFEARSSVVMVWSASGKPFQRFPLTFHNVVMPDQTIMARPSEERMNTLFVTPELEERQTDLPDGLEM